MKKKDLIRELKKLGWYIKREGGRHEIWSNGEIDEPIPRHNELNENLAKSILKKAKLAAEKNKKVN